MKKTAFFFCFCIIFFNLFLIFFQINSSQAEINPIIINQVMIGQDDNVLNEFIELYNPNDVAIDLKNYSLKKKTISDNESSLISSKKFNGIIPAKSYFLISSPVFGPSIKSDLNYSNSNSLSPNNTLILYDADKNISDQILLNDLVLLKNNQSLKRASLDSQIDTNFVIESDNITIINSKNEIITISNYQEVATSTDTTINQSSSTDYQITNLKNIKNLPNKSLVIVEGLVSVLPGVLGTQYFYIHDKYDDDYNVYGLKIYNYNKLFPELKIGDQIQVQGEVAISSNNELSFKIKTKDISDIKIISNNNPLPTSTIENINSFTKTQADNLKTIQGQITQNSNGEIYLNDNQNEILIKIKTGTKISSKKLVVGQNFLISGLLAFASSSSLPQIIPINLESIKNLDIIEENIEIADSQTLNNEFWETNTQKRNKIILIYLIIFIIFTAIFIFFKKK